MERKLSLQDYELFYTTALTNQKESQLIIPKIVDNVETLQQICRVCGCPDDGKLIGLDEEQEFEFELSISSYRMLFQRTSLQFQFHTMPDLPACICATCAYKVKIFYLLTRQFIVNQYAMRNVITEFYRKKYGIEAPEQSEDLVQLKKQLAIIDANNRKPPPKDANKCLIKACVTRRPSQLNRSASVDNKLNDDARLSKDRAGRPANLDNRNKNQIFCHLSQSAMNIGHPPCKCNSQPKKMANKPGPVAAAQLTYRKETPKERNATQRESKPQECIVSPRIAKGSKQYQRPLPIQKTARTPSPTDKPSVPIESPSARQTVSLSKAQLQKKLQERRRQWR